MPASRRIQETRRNRIREAFATMPVLDYAEACRWLARHPDAGAELFRLARNAKAIVPHGDGRWRGNGMAPDGWPL